MAKKSFILWNASEEGVQCGYELIFKCWLTMPGGDSASCRNCSNFFLKIMISVISVQILVWVSMRKKFYMGKYINYILYQKKTSYVEIFPVHLRMTMIFTDFPTGSVRYWKSVNIKSIP